MAANDKLKISDADRFKMFAKIWQANRVGHTSRDDIMMTYLEVINKTRYSWELQEALDACIVNENNLRKFGKGTL